MWGRSKIKPTSPNTVQHTDFSEAFLNQEEAMKQEMLENQAKIKQRLDEIRNTMRLDMEKKISKQNELCKTGKFPTNFKCSVMVSAKLYHLDQHNSVKPLPILEEIRTTSPNRITFDQKGEYIDYDEFYTGFNVKIE